MHDAHGLAYTSRRAWSWEANINASDVLQTQVVHVAHLPEVAHLPCVLVVELASDARLVLEHPGGSLVSLLVRLDALDHHKPHIGAVLHHLAGELHLGQAA